MVSAKQPLEPRYWTTTCMTAILQASLYQPEEAWHIRSAVLLVPHSMSEAASRARSPHARLLQRCRRRCRPGNLQGRSLRGKRPNPDALMNFLMLHLESLSSSKGLSWLELPGVRPLCRPHSTGGQRAAKRAQTSHMAASSFRKVRPNTEIHNYLAL